MIIITDIKKETLPDDIPYYEIYNYEKFKLPDITKMEESCKQIVEREVIYPELFIDYTNKKHIIGWSKKVQEEIGVPFEAFKNMSNMLCDYHYDITKLTDKLNHYKNMTFYQKIKFIFNKK